MINFKARQTISTLSFLIWFFLVFSSTTLADVAYINNSQGHIRHLLGTGMSECHLGKEDTKYFKEASESCFGLSAVWLYSQWLQFVHPEKVGAYNGNWRNTIGDILGTGANCDNIKKFASLVRKLHDSQYTCTFKKEMSKLGDGYKIQREYSITSLLTLDQLKQLLKEDIVREHKLILIHSHNHTTALFKNAGHYYYFDPNYIKDEIRTLSTDRIARSIFKSNNFNHDKSSPLSLEIFSFDEKIPQYPSNKEIFEHINPSLVCDGGCPDGTTGLHQAANLGCNDSVIYFLERGVNPDMIDKHGWTALMHAVRYNQSESVRLLLKKGASPDVIDVEKNWTALMLAVCYNRIEIIQLLLAHKADPRVPRENGITALMLAEYLDYTEIVKLLQKAVYDLRQDEL